jgi:DNA-binding CsgD family transcriptional regulator
MYLSAGKAKVLGEVLSTLAEQGSQHALREQMGEQILDLLDAQHYASYVWNPGSQSFGDATFINMDATNLASYERYYQYHDPITPAMSMHRTAVRATDVMPHEDLRRTMFFNDFLARDGLHWGVNLYAWSGSENLGDIRVWRGRTKDNFTLDELELLDFLRAPFVAALRRCRPTQAPAPCSVPAALLTLSEREREVAQLMSCGLADKEIARRLGISMATVRTHVGHAFRKTGVDSRMKLVQALGL